MEIGKHTYGIENVDFQVYKGSECNIEIGKYCSIGPDVRIITGGIHPPEWVSLYPFRIQFKLKGAFLDGMPRTNGNIVIGNDVWIGTGVTILSGVFIGDGAIVATGSLVTKNLDPYCIYGGVPCKLIKKRFPDDDVKKLQDIAWWNWDEIDVLDAVELLSSENIKDFLIKYKLK